MADYLTGVDFRSEFKGVTVTSGATAVVILGPLDLGRYPRKAFSIYNQSDVTLSGVVVQINPDLSGFETGASQGNPSGATQPPPNPGLWHTFDATTFQSMAPGEVRTRFAKDDVIRWWRLTGTSSLPGVTASGWLHATTV